MREATTRRLRIFALLILAGTSILVAPYARAEGELPVAVIVTECEALDSEQLLHLFRVELRERWAQEMNKRNFVVTLRCIGPDIVLAVAAPEDEKPREPGVRLVPRHEVDGEVGARLLVLQAMELLHEVERDSAGESRVPSDHRDMSEAEQPNTHARGKERGHGYGKPNTLIGGVEMLSYDMQAPLLGAHVQLDRALMSWLYARVGGSIVTRRAGQGLVSVSSQASLFRAEVGFRDGTEYQTVGAGLGVRVAFARMTGSSEVQEQQTGSVSSTLWGPYGVAFFDMRLGGPVVSRLAGEVGHTTSRLRGRVSGGEDTLLGGAWIGLSLGLGLKF